MAAHDVIRNVEATAQFAAELTRLRTKSDMSQRQLGRLTQHSGQQVGAIERSQRNPSRRFAEAADVALNANGSLQRLWPGRRAHVPALLEKFAELEENAVCFNIFQCQVVPGLLQTLAYARAVVGATWPPISDEEIEHRIKGRLHRQEILKRPHPPMVCAVVDEGVLRRVVGGPAVMAEQIRVLSAMAKRSFVELQVLPLARGAHCAMDGSFHVLELSSTEAAVYAELPDSSRIIRSAETVANSQRRFGSLRSAALSPEESLIILEQLLEGFEHG